MLTKLHKLVILAWAVITALALHTGCANRGSGPQGGPKDELPPIVIGCTPANGSVNIDVAATTFELEFDEIIQVDNVMQNVVISPPQKNLPTIKAMGRKLRIAFEDSLQANTTYTFEFNKAIVDNNERNPLTQFVYVISTGSRIDSLQISGKVIDAHTLSPMPKLSVGVHLDHSDSAFLQKPFDRMGKTNENGEFTIRNMAQGTYRLYALKDVTNSHMYLPAGADIAFYDSLITPELHLHGKVDTIWKSPLKEAYDTIIVNTFAESYPKDLLLKSFIEKAPCRQLLDRPKRLSDRKFQITYACPTDTLPTLTLLNDSAAHSNWYIMEPMMAPDSLVYWITDSLVYQRDTLVMAIDYLMSDSAQLLVPARDTVELTYTAPKPRTQRRKNKEVVTTPKATPLTFKHNLNSTLEVYDTVQFIFDEPIASFCKDSIGLYHIEEDTIEVPVPFRMAFNDSICATKAYLGFTKDFEKKYQLRIDSAAFISIYGKATEHFNKPFQFKQLDAYANLYVNFPYAPHHAIVELLNTNEKVLMQSTIIDGEAYFEDLAPGNVVLRLFVDENNNKVWDTGSVLEHKQAETVYYFPNIINLRANWDVEETWTLQGVPFDQQRPKDLKSKKK